MPAEKKADKSRSNRKPKEPSKPSRSGPSNASKPTPSRPSRSSSLKPPDSKKAASGTKSNTTSKTTKNGRDTTPNARPSRPKPGTEATSERDRKSTKISTSSSSSSKVTKPKSDSLKVPKSRDLRNTTSRTTRDSRSSSRVEKESDSKSKSRSSKSKVDERGPRREKPKDSNDSKSKNTRNKEKTDHTESTLKASDNKTPNNLESLVVPRTKKVHSATPRPGGLSSSNGVSKIETQDTVDENEVASSALLQEKIVSSVEPAGDGQHSLDTQESGISVSTPPALSQEESDEVDEVEESISSRLVEVDDGEVVDEIIVEDEDEGNGYEDSNEDKVPDALMNGEFDHVSGQHEEDGGFVSTEYEVKEEVEAIEAIIEEPSQERSLEQDAPNLDEPKTSEENEGVKNEDNEQRSKEDNEEDQEVLSEDLNDVVNETNNAKKESANETAADEPEDDPYGDDEFEDYESDFEDEMEEEEEDEEEELDDEDDSEADEITEDDEDISLTEETSAYVRHPSISGPTEASTSYAEPENSTDSKSETDKATTNIDERQKEEIAKIMRPKTSTFVNFAKLKEKHSVNQAEAQVDSRGRTLLNMIKLDTISLDLLTLQPINYDAFISSFGLNNTQQVGIQTNEDNLDQEVQSDEIVMVNKWTQQPISVDVGPTMTVPPTPQDYLGVGGDSNVEHFLDQDEELFGHTAAGDVARLTKFLSAASRVVLAVLEEESVYQLSSSYVSDGNLSHGTGGGGFSNQGVMLGSGGPATIGALLSAASVTCVKFADGDPSVLITGHSFEEQTLRSSSSSPVDYSLQEGSSSGLVCVWSVHEPSQPKHLLRCNSAPVAVSACPAHSRPLIVLAGLRDASIAAWDLREPSYLHPLATYDQQEGGLVFLKETLGGGAEEMNQETTEGRRRRSEEDVIHEEDEEEEEGRGTEQHKEGRPRDSEAAYRSTWRVQVPSYITACGKDSREGTSTDDDTEDAADDAGLGSAPIIALLNIDPKLDSVGADDTNGAFQVISLSSNGRLIWWVVIQQREGRGPASSSSSDPHVSSHLGATPWSKLVIRMAHSVTVGMTGTSSLQQQLTLHSGPQGAPLSWCTDCDVSPIDCNTLYVSTGSGGVRHISRLSNKVHPALYLPELEPSCSCTCVSVCPHLPNYILVGCSDGSIRLHEATSSRPLATWASPRTDTPQPVKAITWSGERPCVFYVHEESCIHVWDLSAGDMLPVASLTTGDLIGEEGPMLCAVAPCRLHKRPVVNAVFGSTTGRLVLRGVEKDFLIESQEDYESELERC